MAGFPYKHPQPRIISTASSLYRQHTHVRQYLHLQQSSSTGRRIQQLFMRLLDTYHYSIKVASRLGVTNIPHPSLSSTAQHGISWSQAKRTQATTTEGVHENIMGSLRLTDCARATTGLRSAFSGFDQGRRSSSGADNRGVGRKEAEKDRAE